MIVGRRSVAAFDALVKGIVVGATRYTEVNLSTAEVERSSPEHGELIDKSGAPVIALPADLKPCPAEIEGKHPVECWCHGTGQIAIRKPAIDALDPVDDGLTALEDAIAMREQSTGIDPHLGDTTANLMRHSIDVKGSSSGAGNKKSPEGGGGFSISAGRTSVDGRLERTGRPPRFDKPRPAIVRATIAPSTASALDADDSDIAELADELLAQPDVRETLAEVKAAAKPVVG